METEPNETRRAQRRNADRPSTLRGEGSGPHDSWVHDVSQTGMRIECLAELAIGEEVSVGLAGAGATLGRIVWRKENQYGCDFLDPLSEEAAATAFSASPVVRLSAFSMPVEMAAPVPEVAMPIDIFEGRPASARYWMMGFTVAIAAVAMPVALIMVRMGV